MGVVRVAAVADVHCHEQVRGRLARELESVNDRADAVRWSLKLLECAPMEVAAPLLGAGLLALVGFVMAVVLVLFLFTVHPALALIPVAGIAAAVYLFARWEQRRFRPPGVGPP